MRRRFLLAIIFFLLLSTYNIQNKFRLNIPIEKIIVENNELIKDETIRNQLTFLYDTNLFFLKVNKINEKLNEIDLIESYEIKKVFPEKIIIKVFEKKPIAIIQDKRKKLIYTNNHDVIKYFDLDKFENLPLVYASKINFKKFYKSLNNNEFPLNEIKTLYFFESNRWDILTKDDKTIRLPINHYEKSLKNYLSLKDKSNFKKYKIFDYRIKDQLILK